MEDDSRTGVNDVCRRCGSTEALAAADARAIGFLDEFAAGLYSCCQVVRWADEQWIAWQEAASEDGKSPEEVTKPLEFKPDALLAAVSVRKPKL